QRKRRFLGNLFRYADECSATIADVIHDDRRYVFLQFRHVEPTKSPGFRITLLVAILGLNIDLVLVILQTYRHHISAGRAFVWKQNGYSITSMRLSNIDDSPPD